GDPAAERLIQVRVEADQLRMDRERLETLLAEVPTSGIRIEAMEVIPAVRSSSELSQALTELARARADIRRLELTEDAAQLRLISSLAQSLENVAIPRLGQAVVDQLRDREDLARRQSADAEALLTDIPPQRIEEARLSRQVAVAGTLFQDTYRAYEETTMAQAVARPDVRVLDVAVAPLAPQKPASTSVVMVLLAALVAAVGVPLLLDSLNPALREGSDIVDGLGTQLLGVLPHIGAGGGDDAGHEGTVNAFHELRRNVTFALNGGGPITFAVSSPGAGEGKSVTAANLAFAFAEAGREVVLLDANVRSGRLHEAVGADPEPGLTDLLMADCTLTDTIQATPMDGVELIAAGTFAEDGPELLGSPELESHLRELRSRYDVVIVDCPALDVGGDAVLLSIAAGAVVMVFRHGQTHSERARATMDWISRFPFRVAGAVFNDVPLRKARSMRPSAAPVLNLPHHLRS
ncbi:MAG: AAA family ATPase, partial [Gemmatimonadota bacterium]|nr:AAA family ATPase [Gemmatimonadota bacterium]